MAENQITKNEPTHGFQTVEKPLYYSIGDFYKKRLGKKFKKIPVTVADDCPNRRGLRGMETCIFCDAWGSAAYPEQRELTLRDQIASKMSYFKEKYRSPSFLIYFQAYTSTFLGVKSLRQSFETALSFSEVEGLVIGTRPDCLSPAVFELWNDFSARSFMSVELGVQTFFEDQIEFLKRGHSAELSKEAVKKIKHHCPQVDLGIHLMFGLPGETLETIIETARIVSSLPIDNVKLHNLHVLKNTPLEKLYEQKLFIPISLEDYTERVALFLQHLSPTIAVQRLAALSSRWEELVAPEWTKHKMKNYQFILAHMRRNGKSQGQFYVQNHNGSSVLPT